MMTSSKNTSPVSGRFTKILIITAVDAEKESLLKGLNNDSRFTVEAGGAGPVAAGVSAACFLAKDTYDLVINAGIGGGFTGQAEIGSIVAADQIIAADFGAESQEGFLPVEELGFGCSRLTVNKHLAETITEAFIKAGLPARTGPVLTVSTATGTAETAEELQKRVPGAAAEAMEGFGVAWAAHKNAVSFMEIRAISNEVGPRDKGSWKIKEALDSLTEAARILKEEL
jgi:futalosine hydrolase